MEGNDKTYWEWIKKEREADLVLEVERGEDDNLIKLLKQEIEEAEENLKQINNGL